MGTIEVKNVVTDYYVNNNNFGGDPNYNTEQIQEALDDAESEGGGIVYFPAGRYLINNTLKLPNRVFMLGIGGTTFGTLAKDIGTANFLDQPATIIKLDNDSNVNMIEPKGDSAPEGNKNFYQSGIENFVLWGNKSNQSDGNGIYIDNTAGDENDANRGHVRFRNILLYQFWGIGLYGGSNQHELYLDEIVAFGCGLHGLELKGQDIKASRLQSAANGGTGLRITGGGAGRFYDIDFWANDIGIEIFDTMNIFFFGLAANLNKKQGLYIYKSGAQGSYPPSQIQIWRGIFDANSTLEDGAYSDIKLESNTNGPEDIEFIGCKFRGGSNERPNYPIMDVSSNPARNLVSNCYFNRNNYSSQRIINVNSIYKFRDCYDFTNRSILDEHTLQYKWLNNPNNNHQLLITDCYIAVSVNLGSKTIKLPHRLDTQLGKVYYVTKVESSGNSVTVGVNAGDSISGPTTINQIYKALMIINSGSQWLSIQIS